MKLEISITGRHMNLENVHRDYVEKRLGQLKRFFDGVLDIHVILSKEKHRQSADITIHVNGVTLHGEEETDDFYSSIDRVTDKIEKQLRRYKDRLRERRRRGNGEKSIRYTMELLSGDDLEKGRDKPQVIRTTTMRIKPLSLDEAVMQMDLLNQEFLVFRNAGNDLINVLYRRPDGDYYLVEPEA